MSTNIFDFIKTNNQVHLKTLRKLHDIFIKISRLCDMLSFTKGEIFVYMSSAGCVILTLNCDDRTYQCWPHRNFGHNLSPRKIVLNVEVETTNMSSSPVHSPMSSGHNKYGLQSFSPIYTLSITSVCRP